MAAVAPIRRVDWRAALHVCGRSVYHYRRTWALNLVPNFCEPIVYPLGMGVGLGSYLGDGIPGGDYLAYLAPGLAISNAMNGGAFGTTYNLFVKMRFNRTYEAILATPVTAVDAMVGELVWASCRGLIYGAIFALVMVPFGILSPLGALMLLPVAALTAWLFGAIGMLFTSFIAVIDLYSFFYTLFLMPLFLCSGIFFPLDRLPGWVMAAAWWTPLYHAVALARAAATLQLTPGHAIDVAWLCAVAAACSVWAVARLARSLAP